MDLSIIIVNYNTAPYLAPCLASIGAHLADVRYEVCVVDNASTDGSATVIHRQFPHVQLIASDRNLGFAAGLNLGLRHTSGQVALWLNPDSELLDVGMAKLLQYLDEHPDVGILGPQILDADGGIQLSSRSFPSYRTALFHRYSLITRWFPNNRYSRHYLHSDWDHNTVHQVDWVSGACLLHRRRILDDIGWLDERFFMYCEDVDFCLRARQAGWKVTYHPGAQVLHHIAGSSRRHPSRMALERHRSMWRYYAKHFRRNVLKDAVVGAAIWARCGWTMAREALSGQVNPSNSPRGLGLREGVAGRVWVLPPDGLKRVFDIALSGAGLVVSLPVWGVIALAIKREDGGPVFFKNDRVGRGGIVFNALKFRTMVHDANTRFGPRQATEYDPRVTRIGRRLRTTALDELPQLWNIFRGDMSFVGPRALAPEEIEVSGNGELIPLQQIPSYEARHRVRPGLTGLAQIYAPRDLPRRQKFRLDLLYIKRQSFCLDLRLIALSFWITFRAKWESRGRKF